MEEDLDDVASGKRPWVPLLEAFYPPLRERVDEVRKTTRRRDFTTEPSDEVCSLGHPMVIRLGRNGRFLACSLYPEHKESRPLPGDEPPPQEGEGETCPKCGEGTLVAKRGRFGPFVGCDRYPDCDFIKREGPEPPPQLPFEVICPKNTRRPPRGASRAADRQRLLGVLELPQVRLHDELRADRRAARRGRRARREEGRGLHLPEGRRGDRGRRPRARWSGCASPGGPPNPEAIAPARRGGRPGGGRSGGARTAPRTAPRRGGTRTKAGAVADVSPTRRAPDAATWARHRPLRSPRSTPLERFLLGLRAKDASEHTLRSYATAVGTYLDWLAERGVDWRTPSRTDLRAYLARLVGSGARTSVSQRLAAIRSFHRFAARAGLAAGDPWGAIATPRLPRRLPRVLELDQIVRLLAVIDADEARAGQRRDEALAGAIALRDRAIIEVAYAAGLRISELAGADLRRSTCGAARSGSSARAARSGSGSSAGRRSPRSMPTSRSRAGARGPAARRRPPSLMPSS